VAIKAQFSVGIDLCGWLVHACVYATAGNLLSLAAGSEPLQCHIYQATRLSKP